MDKSVLTDDDILRVAAEWQTCARTRTIVLNAEIIDYSRMLLAAAEPVIRAEERERCAALCERMQDGRAAGARCAAGIRSLGAGSKGEES